MDVADAALRFVAQRHKAGRIGDGRAKCLRGCLLLFARDAPADLSACRRKHVERFVHRRELAPGTRALRWSSIRVFFRWCLDHRYVQSDPTCQVERPVVPALAPRNLTADEAAALVAACRNERERVMVLLTLQEGLRCVEIARAEVGDVDLVRETMHVRGKGGHGAITRAVPLSPETARAIRAYHRVTPATAGPLVRNENHPHRGLPNTYISRLIGNVYYRAGVKNAPRDGRSAHSGRHTMATDLVQAGVHPVTVQQALGHRSISSTQRYLRGVTPDLRAAMAGRSYGSCAR